jgi:hypothetical protein
MFRPKQMPTQSTGQSEPQAVAAQVIVLQERLRKTLCLMATETWRLQRKIERLPSASSPEELTGITASVNRMESGLRDIGIECREYTNQPYDPGMQLTVLAYEAVEGIDTTREMILQTVAPSVFFGGQLIQQGEVVVSSVQQTAEGKE